MFYRVCVHGRHLAAESKLSNALIVIDSRRRPKASQEGQEGQVSNETAGASLFEEKPRTGKEKVMKGAQKPTKLNITQLKELEAKKEQEAVLSFGRIKQIWGRMLAGDQDAESEWMHEAELLAESFRETRALFLTSRVSQPLLMHYRMY